MANTGSYVFQKLIMMTENRSLVVFYVAFIFANDRQVVDDKGNAAFLLVGECAHLGVESFI